MSRILTITNFGDFQFIEQTRELNQIRHTPSNTFVETRHTLGIQYKLAARDSQSMEQRMKSAYEFRGGKYA